MISLFVVEQTLILSNTLSFQFFFFDLPFFCHVLFVGAISLAVDIYAMDFYRPDRYAFISSFPTLPSFLGLVSFCLTLVIFLLLCSFPYALSIPVVSVVFTLNIKLVFETCASCQFIFC